MNGIYDAEGMKLDGAFTSMHEVEADIFTFNETHGDDQNPLARQALKKSRQRIYKGKEHCRITTSSSSAPVTNFSKPGGNMVGVTGPLSGRVRKRIDDKYGRWCGFTLAGKDDREIMVLTAYNVPQEIKAGNDTLHAQQTSLYMLDGIDNPKPREQFMLRI